MNALDILKKNLTDFGADGLCHSNGSCGCGLEELQLCDGWIGLCVPANRKKDEDGDYLYFPMEVEE